MRRRLGAGGFGVVYEVFDRDQGIVRALKTLHRATPTSLLQLKREFRELQDIHHKNLVSLRELAQVDGSWFVTMDYVPGVDLLTYVRPGQSEERARASTAAVPRGDTVTAAGTLTTAPSPLKQRRRLAAGSHAEHTGLEAEATPGAEPSAGYDELRLRTTFAQLADALHALHEAGKVHRDIKPSNVLVRPNGDVAVLDFGLICEHSEQVEGPARFVGTAAYAAPEQAVGAQPAPAADFYSLGVILYEALTGSLPFRGRAADMLHNKRRVAANPPSWKCRVPTDLDELCAALLDRDPTRRPSYRSIVATLRGNAHADTHRVDLTDTAETFVGRTEPLAALEGAATSSREKTTSVLVRGGSGIGKSTLLAEFARRQRERGALLLQSRCHRRDSVPFKAVDGLVDALATLLLGWPADDLLTLRPPHADALARMFPVTAQLFDRVPPTAAPAPDEDARAPSPDPQELRQRATIALRELCRAVAEVVPLVLLVDDLQWADEDSVHLIADLLAPPDSPRLLFVGAVRDDTASGFSAGELVSRLGGAEELPLAPLSGEATRTLAASLVGPASDALDRIAEEAAGHPLFAFELARHARSGNSSPHREAVTLEKLLGTRVAALSAESQRLVAVTSVAHAPLPSSVAASAAHLSPAEFEYQLGALRAGRLVDGEPGTVVEPYHDRVRAAVLGTLTAVELTDLHRAIAIALEQGDPENAESIAVHWADAGERVRAAGFAKQAADRAASALAFERAARLYRWTLDLARDADCPELSVPFIHAHLAENLSHAGHTHEAGHAYLAASEFYTEPFENLTLRRRALGEFLGGGHLVDGHALLSQLTEELNIPVPRNHLLAHVGQHFRLQRTVRKLGREPQTPAGPFEQLRMDVCWDAAMGFAILNAPLSAHFNSLHLEMSNRCADPQRHYRALIGAAAYLGAAHRYIPASRKMIRRARELAPETGLPGADAWLDILDGFLTMLHGDWPRARRLLARGRERLDATPPPPRDGSVVDLAVVYMSNVSKVATATTLARTGRLREWERHIGPTLRAARARGDDTMLTHLLTGVQSIPRLALYGVDAAREADAESRKQWTPEGCSVQAVLHACADVLIKHYSGDPEAAYRAVRDIWGPARRSMMFLVEHLRVVLHECRARTAIAVAAQSGWLKRERLCREALASARAISEVDSDWAQSVAAVFRAGVAAVRGRTAEAIPDLERAIRHYARAEMELDRLAASAALARMRGLPAASQAFLDELADLGCTDPGRMAAMLTPGFGL